MHSCMTFGSKRFRALLVAAILLLFSAALSALAEPFDLDMDSPGGLYIGRYVEYLSEGLLFEAQVDGWALSDIFKKKMLSGRLHSDEKVVFNLEHIPEGYRADMQSREGAESKVSVMWGVNDVQQREVADLFMKAEKRVFRLDFRPHSYWLRFKIQNDSNVGRNLVLELDKHTFQTMDLFLPVDSGYQVKRGEFLQSLDSRESGYKNLAFSFTAHPGLSMYYIRVDSWLNEVIPLRLWSLKGFQRHKTVQNTLLGIVAGIFICVFFFNFLLYLFVRERSYLYLSLVTVCGFLLHISSSGFGFQFLWPGRPIMGLLVVGIAFPLSFAFFFFFCRSFIDIAVYTPGMDKIVGGLAYISLAVALAMLLMPLEYKKGAMGLILAIDKIYYLPILYPAIMAVRSKDRSGVFLLIGISFFFLSNLEWFLSSLDIIPFHLIEFIHIKAAGFLIIMTLALADRINSMKESLSEVNISLERKVAERTGDLLSKTKDLEQANIKLKELDKAKSHFFANISHELRTPLTLISAPLDSFIKGDYGDLSKSNLYILGSMKRNADRLLRLINNLLDFSKIEARKMKLRIDACDIPELLAYCLASIESTVTGRDINTFFIDKTNGLVAHVDKDLLEKAVFNLLANAIKFNRQGGSIRLELKTRANQFRISVKDTGIGIPAEMHSVIFERFGQVDDSSTRQYEGTGIGLALTKEIVDMHGGEIHVQSLPGEGATFTIELPVSLGEKSQAPDAAWEHPVIDVQRKANIASIQPLPISRDREQTKSHCVLIIEDNTDMRAYLESLLGKTYATVTADNGSTALKKMKANPVDLVLVDLMMPEMDGFEFIRTVRASEMNVTLPIIILTAKSDIPDRVEGIELGANDYLIKPFNPDELLARIRSQIKFKELREVYLKSERHGKSEKNLTEKTKHKVEIVKKFLDKNYRDEISRDGLAEAVDMSPDHLGRMFKQYTGSKISEHLNSKRIEAACKELKETNRKIIDIAFGVGFDTLRTFNKVFLESVGVNPTNYRKQSSEASK